MVASDAPKAPHVLQVHFEGYFLCRLTTDPDPTDEPRGVSGYTMALVHEAPLDQVIRTQIEDKKFLKENLREPAPKFRIDRVRNADRSSRRYLYL